GSDCYALLRGLGLDHGPYYRSLQWVRWSDDEALSLLVLPEAAARDRGYLLHPSLLDGALQTCAPLFSEVGALWARAEEEGYRPEEGGMAEFLAAAGAGGAERVLAALPGPAPRLRIPFSVEAVTVHQALPSRLYCHARPLALPSPTSELRRATLR